MIEYLDQLLVILKNSKGLLELILEDQVFHQLLNIKLIIFKKVEVKI
jgi:hypothetical protein